MLRKKSSKPRLLSEYPSGVFLHTEKGYFYVHSPTVRYYFLTRRVLDSWSPQTIIEASEDDAAVKQLTIFAKMKFRNGSLLYSQANGSMYLVSGSKLRRITNPFALDALNLHRKDAVWVSPDELNLHEMGLDIH